MQRTTTEHNLPTERDTSTERGRDRERDREKERKGKLNGTNTNVRYFEPTDTF